MGSAHAGTYFPDRKPCCDGCAPHEPCLSCNSVARAQLNSTQLNSTEGYADTHSAKRKKEENATGSGACPSSRPQCAPSCRPALRSRSGRACRSRKPCPCQRAPPTPTCRRSRSRRSSRKTAGTVVLVRGAVGEVSVRHQPVHRLRGPDR
eukprot:scaffold84695_cov62-Phaeocystis_antarctica.AAC.2